jgi:hypothetical protein
MRTPRTALALILAIPFAASWTAAADGSDDVVSGFAAAAAKSRADAAAENRAAIAGAAAGQAAAPAPDSKKVNLLAEFVDPSTRNQGGIGSCHAFGSVAVLEAAFFRKYREHVVLAEEDVFLRRTVLSGDVYREFCSGGKCTMTEGNDPEGDIRYVLDHGALSGGSYVRFADRYVKYRNAEQKTMEGIQRTYEEMGWLEKLMYDPRAHWKELQMQSGAKKILSSYLEGRGSMESAERESNQKKFAGFRLRTKSDFDFKPENKDLPPKDCRARGAAQRVALKTELDQHRPLCVSMSLSGLAAWGQTDKTRDAYHAFMIVGYDATPAGLVFHTRNSWGGDNPDIPDTETCRIYQLNSVLTPTEKETF